MASAGIIVLAEDDAKLRRIYTDTLTAAGFHVLAAADGLKALALLNKVTPRVVVLDIMMPRLNGIETCKRARGIIGYDIPILFLSALDRLDVLRNCIAVGGDDYMIKSDSVASMVERVQQWSRRGGMGQLAERRKLMLADFADKVAEYGGEPSEELLSSDNDEDVRAISAFVAEARMQAGETFGVTVAQKLHLIGYVTGAVEHWSEVKGTLDKSFNDYLRGVLRETGILTDEEVVDMVSSFAELSKDRNFTTGREYGRNDPIKRNQEGESYIPNGLAAFKSQSEASKASA